LTLAACDRSSCARAELYLSAHTVKSHINRIFAKTGSTDRAAAVRYAREQKLA
jgi:DNA-binding CsgD family transcriptional regulator